MLIFDIETGPLPTELIAHLVPREGEVKVGNTKDKDKIAVKVKEAQASFIERAALDATTGQALAIGTMWQDNDGKHEVGILCHNGEHGESDMLLLFWDTMSKWTGPIVGFNIHGFDLPFLVRRSWLLGVDVPSWVLVDGRYWSPKFVDLMKVWTFGSHNEFVKLDTLARALGLPGKPEGVTGADFARLWEADREKATEYLRGDLRMTWAVAEALQIS